MHDTLTRRLKANPYVRAVFHLEPGAFLVGGAVRDYLHCIVTGKAAHGIYDYDFMLPGGDMEGRVGVIRKSTGGTLIKLGNEGLVRIALKNGRTLDFTPLNQSVDENLASRDFTINAIAWSWNEGMVDPLDGLSSIIKGEVTHTSEASLTADPLRLLRAYRFMSEKGWPIAPDTRATIIRLATLASAPADERIFTETVKLCNGQFFNDAIRALLADTLGLIIYAIKSDRYETLFQSLHHIDRFSKNSLFRMYFNNRPSGLSRAGIIRLMTMLLYSGSPSAGLSLPSNLAKRASHLRAAMDYLNRAGETKEASYDLFRLSGPACADVLIISGRFEWTQDLTRFHQVRTDPLLEAAEVMRITGLGQGKSLGSIIDKLRRRTFSGDITSKEQARAWLASLRNH